MSQGISAHIHQNVVGYVALVVAVMGIPTAYAVGRNSIGSGELKRGAVRTSDIANDAVTSPKVEDRSLLAEDFARGELPSGVQGPPGPAGSPDTGDEILAKLAPEDGAGSGLDADLLDGINSAGFVRGTDQAGGDLSGPFSGLQLGGGSVDAAALGLAFFAVETATFADAAGGGATEQVIVDGPAFDIVGQCADNDPSDFAQLLVRSSGQVALIGVSAEGALNGFVAGTPPSDQQLLSVTGGNNAIKSASYSVTALDTANQPVAQMVGVASAGPLLDAPVPNNCFFAVSAMS